MKKVFAIAFIGSIFALSCSKKTDKSLQDTNVMLEEPAAPTVAADSTAKTQTAPAAAIPAPSPSTDSTATAK
ncbi:hypothetical protein LNP04_19230 [Chryseobacterium sp. C-71]|uniref:hypothetical protein n=1 Tax=Chryseobacterium sp. C-71 TaxID=2893882 RepID=UPI001E2B6AC4|nr:hypothetical protein [Chryseobacterium sp. C-71]UFH32075.1 hypothetical protein LNP04_19230 [Chryseobacterium sp. C-71]